MRPLSGPAPTSSDCPSSPVSVRTIPDTERQVRGSGPAYISVGPQSGYFGKYGVWIEPRIRGPVLVRGSQIGGGQGVLFGDVSGNPAPAGVASVLSITRQADLISLFYPELDMGPSDSTHGWRGWLGYWAMPATGCYFLQADGADFSQVIVFPVTPGLSEGKLIFNAP